MKPRKKIGLCGLCVSIFRGINRRATSKLFWVGVAFLIFNFPIGYGSLGLAGVMTSITQNKSWAIIGTIGYIVSWCMLGLAPILMGRRNFVIVKQVIKDKIAAWKRLRKRYKKQ